MAIPKSAKLASELSGKSDFFTKQVKNNQSVDKTNGVLAIRPVQCCNDFVAIVQTQTESTIELVEAQKFQNEGIVVGVGPGLATVNGTRCTSQLAIGDRVAFYGNPVLAIDAKDGPFVGKHVVIYPERSIICHLIPKPEFVIINE